MSVFVLAALALLQRVRHSPYGRVLRAIRDDDQGAAVAGKRVIGFKVQAFARSTASTPRASRRRRSCSC